LAGNTKLLILDEPTEGLDVKSKQQIFNLVSQLKLVDDKSILICTQNLEEAEKMSD
jgi:ABC-type multidrug transport system ATPase subunit